MRFMILSALLALAGCTGLPQVVGEPVVVARLDGEPFLNLRSGPSLQYAVVLGLPEGTALSRHGCVTELNQRWCEVTLAGAPGARGYVSADYLAPR